MDKDPDSYLAAHTDPLVEAIAPFLGADVPPGKALEIARGMLASFPHLRGDAMGGHAGLDDAILQADHPRRIPLHRVDAIAQACWPIIGRLPFAPGFVDVLDVGQPDYFDGSVWGNVVEEGEAGTLTVYNWVSPFRRQGHSLRALEWLSERYPAIEAKWVTVRRDDGQATRAMLFWSAMVDRGLVQRVIASGDDEDVTDLARAIGAAVRRGESVSDLMEAARPAAAGMAR